jgi:uncharacterized protein (TIGR02246 family)
MVARTGFSGLRPWLVGISILLAGCAAPPSAPVVDVEAARAEIAAVNQQFQAAFAAGDAAALAALYTGDGQLLPPNGPAVKGTDAIRDFWQGALDAGIRAVILSTRELDVLGDTATELGGYTVGLEDGQTVDEGSYVVVWKRQGEAWRLHWDIWNGDRVAGEE